MRFRCAAYIAAGALLAASVFPAPSAAEVQKRRYELYYDVQILPTEGAARVVLRIGSGASYLKWIRFSIDPERHLGFEGDGELQSEARFVRWMPPPGGGELRYSFHIDHLRDDRSYDARCAKSWALFRGDDLVPPARVRARRGAESDAVLRLRAPAGWSVEVPYPKRTSTTFVVDHSDRRFDRPTGWMVAAGELGVLRERVAGVRVAVAAPVGHSARRQDLLALLRWTLPSLRKALGRLPERLLIVSAADPMWRGGLSGPGSLYVHSERPLIAPDGTSPLLHELFHTMTRARSGEGGDWVVEGLAEFYSLEMLVRSRSMSRWRFEKAQKILEQKARRAQRLRVPEADAAVKALAVGVLRKLDAEIRRRSDGAAGLDDVARLLAEASPVITTELFQMLSEYVAGVDLDVFFRRHVPLD